ncbi:hypothetical protein MTR67_006882 [Solanum verrucosum]|uniref:Uncharacterized protein n=1 Tax=Solanum verrucosum TaxID=315347 RepID=A0AAF0PYT6_SOLVR|nr:hypothetical protein MTR67_006882 [Solanum verrucosum]
MSQIFFECRVSGPSILTLQGHKLTAEIILSLKNISWSMPGKITEALHSWEEAEYRNNWRTVPTTIWWTIWKERNLMGNQ